MALHHYTSTHPSGLAAELARLVGVRQTVFGSPVIVSAHPSTRDWLTRRIAEGNPIAANLIHRRPGDLALLLHRHLFRETVVVDQLRSSQAVWVLYDLLGKEDVMSDPRMATIRQYLAGTEAGEDDSAADLRRFTLAERIAYCFDRYQGDAPELIAAWKAGKAAPRPEWSDAPVSSTWEVNERWQGFLWQALAARTQERMPDRNALSEAVRAHLDRMAPDGSLAARFPLIACFGPLDLPEEFLALLRSLGRHTEVALFRPDAMAAERADDPLVAMLGAMGRRQAERLVGRFPEATVLPSVASDAQGVLGALQACIRGEAVPDGMVPDDTVLVSSSVTPYREVEALYHDILRRLDNDPTLKPSDICVIVPSTEAYAPAVTAVFGNDELPIDHVIYHESANLHASPYAAFAALLALDGEQLSAKAVAGLMEFRHIRERFGLPESTDLAVRAMQAANIRQGMEGDPELGTHLLSWRHGLRRLLFGAMLPPVFLSDDRRDRDGVPTEDALRKPVAIEGYDFLPVGDFEEEDRETLFRIHEFVERLDAWLHRRQEARDLGDWAGFVDESLREFVQLQDHEGRDISRLLEEWTEAAGLLEGIPVPYEVAAHFLKGRLERMEERSTPDRFGVRFTGPNPFLAAPTRIYAFLGLNSGVLPRSEGRQGFDLRHPQRGGLTEMDKQLFLQVLASARDAVYASYIGKDLNKNADRPPGQLMVQLLSTLGELTGRKPEALVLQHPQHAFSPRYNAPEEPRLLRYTRDGMQPVQAASTEGAAGTEMFKVDEGGRIVILLDDLVAFAKDPVKFHYNRHLRIHLSEDMERLPEAEPESVDNLVGWEIKDRILQHRRRGGSVTEEYLLALTRELKETGKLPLGIEGDRAVREGSEAVDSLLQQLPPELARRPLVELNIDVPFEMELDDKEQELDDKELKLRLQGKVEAPSEGTQLFLRASSDKEKYRIEALLRFAALRLAYQGDDVRLLYALRPSGKGAVGEPRPYLGDAEAYLKRVAKSYIQAREGMIPFVTDIDWNNIEDIQTLARSFAPDDSNKTYSLFAKHMMRREEYLGTHGFLQAILDNRDIYLTTGWDDQQQDKNQDQNQGQ